MNTREFEAALKACPDTFPDMRDYTLTADYVEARNAVWEPREALYAEWHKWLAATYAGGLPESVQELILVTAKRRGYEFAEVEANYAYLADFAADVAMEVHNTQ